MIDYENDLNWNESEVTPLGRFYNMLKALDLPRQEIFQIIHALTESGAYQNDHPTELSSMPA